MSESVSSSIYIQINDRKIGRVEVSYSITVAELRHILIKKFGPLLNTYFLDANNYPLYTQDEQLMIIRELLSNNENVIRLKTNENVTVSEIKSKPEVTFPKLSNQSIETSLSQLILPGSVPTLSTNPIIVATQLDSNAWKQVFANCNLFSGIRMDEEILLHAFRPILKFKESSNSIPLFLVNDTSYIRAYMKNKRLQSCFGISKFFDGGLNPCSFFGMNSEFTKRKAAINEERTVYSTCSFNLPRVTLQLDSSYLEPTIEFIEAIDDVLQLPSDQQSMALKKVLITYGHVYPRRVVLGGHLYHTEGHRVKGSTDEEGKLIAAESRFSASLTAAIRIGTGFSNEKKLKEDLVEQDSLSMFEAVGGDTLVSRDPTLWAKSVADYSLWRVIEYDDFESVISLLSQQQQNALKEIIDSNVEQVSNAKSSNTRIMPFHGDASTHEIFNNFFVDFQQKLRTTQEKMKNARESTNS
jgi:hypothetical protein